MKRINISWDNVHDDTGCLFSFAKCLCCVLKNSKFNDFAEDIVATSGFAFRMWINADLCPSAMSIWDFNKQGEWLFRGGIIANVVGRYWGQDEIEGIRRKQAIANIKNSIDSGMAAIAWDIGTPEWGLITGYDDEAEKLFYLSVNGESDEMPYKELGQREIKILNVITIENKKADLHTTYLKNMLEIASKHLSGNEWSDDNKSGLAVYPAFCKYLKEKYTPENKWNAEYYLGSYGALKWYAYQIFKKYGLSELTALYKDTYDCWMNAFNLRIDVDAAETRDKIIGLLNRAYENETKALALMKTVVFDDETPPTEQDYTHIIKATDMQKTLIKELSMKNSGFNDVDLSNTKYVNLNMKNSTFYNINIDYTSFCGSNMNSMGYVCVSQRNSRFVSADLSNSVFTENCSFENAELINCNIKGLKINGIDMEKLIEREHNR